VPELDKLKKKSVLILKARMGDKNAPDINEQNISKEVVIMEVNKQVLETLYFVCQEVYMPVLANPLN
jgi:hypothetical protein